jgi:hypothetical protein
MPVTVAAAPVATGPRVMSVAGSGATLMVAADDGRHATVWFAGAK